MEQYILKAAVVAELERIKKYYENIQRIKPVYESNIEGLNELLSFLDTLEVKEINTWHLQKNEDICDTIKDWKLHVFVCLMDDATIQKFTGIRRESADGSISTHIDAIDDKYNINNIIFWIETPN